MSYTFQDYYRDFTKENLDLLTTEERLKGLPPRVLLQRLSADEIEAYLKKLRKKKPKRK